MLPKGWSQAGLERPYGQIPCPAKGIGRIVQDSGATHAPEECCLQPRWQAALMPSGSSLWAASEDKWMSRPGLRELSRDEAVRCSVRWKAIVCSRWWIYGPRRWTTVRLDTVRYHNRRAVFREPSRPRRLSLVASLNPFLQVIGEFLESSCPLRPNTHRQRHDEGECPRAVARLLIS